MKLMRREGSDLRVSAMFYRAVVQVVLIFGVETWVMLETISRKLERANVLFLRQVTGQKDKRQKNGTWRSTETTRLLKEAGTQSLGL